MENAPKQKRKESLPMAAIVITTIAIAHIAYDGMVFIGFAADIGDNRRSPDLLSVSPANTTFVMFISIIIVISIFIITITGDVIPACW